MRVLCLFAPHFALQVEKRDSGLPDNTPVIIGGLPHERKTVYAASPHAIACGIKTGMPLRQAYGLCPEAHFMPNDEKRYGSAFDEVLDILDGFSPMVEDHEQGSAFLDAGGLGKYHHGEDNLAVQLLHKVRATCGLAASVAVAGNKFTARVAAGLTRPGECTLVPPGQERTFLAPLPIDILPCHEDTRRQLHLLGVRTLGELVGLGSQPVTAQFGKDGLRLHQLACGIDESPLVPRQRPARIEHTLSFEPPVDTVDGLLADVSQTLDSLSARLKERWQLCRRMELYLRFDNGSSKEELVNLKTPTLSGQRLLSPIRLRLEQARFPSPVSTMNIALSGLCQDGSQLSLWKGKAGRKQQVTSAAREIESRFGKDLLKIPIILNQESFLPEQRFALRDIEFCGRPT